MASLRHKSAAAEVDDKFDDSHHHHSQQHKARLPVIPDLRFEYSYIRSVRPYVHVEQLGEGSIKQQQQHLSAEDLLREYEKVELPEVFRSDASAQSLDGHPKEIVHVQWKEVLWVTTRDQVLSPLLQGALWAIASHFLTPYSARLGSKLGHLVRAKSPSKEGTAANWLRTWVKRLGLTSQSVGDSKR